VDTISRSKAVRLCIISALVAALLTAGLGAYALIQFTPVGKVLGIVRLLEQAYYKDFDQAQVLEGAARGVVAALGDPYSVYMTQEEWAEFYIRTSGEYSGIGVTITEKDGGVCIVSPMKGTPAEAAGLRVNDFIIKVDGKPVSSSDEAAALIRGPAGTEVVITIYRDGDMFDVAIVREDITIPAVDYSMKEEGIGYIELITFNEHSSFAMAEAMRELDAQGAKAYILDLRYNGGGLLDRCIDIARLFVPEGNVVTVKGKSFEETSYTSKGPGLDKPLFVLVNGGTASASEILAGAIQDYQVGTLIGTTTFGKGLVQNSFKLKDGSVVKVTIAEYFTPNGRSINGKGLEPDIMVEGDDEQLAKAVELARAELSGAS
jgi:carboxyl-terminal processing protease